MIRRTSCLGALCALLIAVPGAARAGEPDRAAQAFESLYGSDVKRVRLTREAADDLELAARLLAAAKEAAGQPAFLAVLCEKAAEVAGAHPEGAATAVEALGFLAAQIPEQAGACAERLVDVRQKQFEASRGADRPPAGEALIDALLDATGHKQHQGALTDAATLCRRAQAIGRAVGSPRMGEIDARQKALAHAMRTEREIADIRTLLAKDPGNAALREKLVRIHLVQKDDPATAARHLAGVQDEALRKYVPAAAKGAEAAPELACQELGEWYRSLGEAAPDAAKAAMYARAKAYYERFLDLHAPADLARTTASLALGKVEAELAQLGGPPAPTATAARTTPAVTRGIIKPGTWVDLLPLALTEQEGVSRAGKAVSVHSKRGALDFRVPVVPVGDYRLVVDLVRTKSKGTVWVQFPVNRCRPRIKLGDKNNEFGGISTIKGKDVGDPRNPTRVTPCALENGKPYRLEVDVAVKGDQAGITVRLNDRPFVQWQGGQDSLPAGDGSAASGVFHFGTWGSTTVFRSVRLKMLTGEAKLLRPATAAAKTPSIAKPAAPAPSGTTVRTGQWVDLVPTVDLARHAVKGTWERRDATLVLTNAPGGARVMVPAVPLGNYELEVTCRRTWGDSTMAVILPVASTGVVVSLDYDHGSASGLDRVNGESPKKNETRVKAVHMKGKREYVVHSTVQVAGAAAQIDVTLDGEPYIAWKGPLAALSVPKHWRLPTPQAIGVGAFFSRAQFRNVRLKMLTGRAVLPPAKK